MRLADRVALVTGTDSGIGAASAKQFAQEGTRVALLGRERDELELGTLLASDAAGHINGTCIGGA